MNDSIIPAPVYCDLCGRKMSHGAFFLHGRVHHYSCYLEAAKAEWEKVRRVVTTTHGTTLEEAKSDE